MLGLAAGWVVAVKGLVAVHGFLGFKYIVRERDDGIEQWFVNGLW